MNSCISVSNLAAVGNEDFPRYEPNSRKLDEILHPPPRCREHADFLNDGERFKLVAARVVDLLDQVGLLVPPSDGRTLVDELFLAMDIARAKGAAHVCPGLIAPPDLRLEYLRNGWVYPVRFANFKPTLLKVARITPGQCEESAAAGKFGVEVVDIHTHHSDRRDITAMKDRKVAIYKFFLAHILACDRTTAARFVVPHESVIWECLGCYAKNCTLEECFLSKDTKAALRHLEESEKGISECDWETENLLFKRAPTLLGIERMGTPP